jgi:hypothetical protein
MEVVTEAEVTEVTTEVAVATEEEITVEEAVTAAAETAENVGKKNISGFFKPLFLCKI